MEFIKKNKFLIILLFVACVCLFLSTGRLANILIDVGREVYYPKLILDGKVLYKDIFCIYGPLSYLINAFFYKILGAKLTSLFAVGVISALSIVFLTYKISRKFLSELNSFIITFFVISTGCLATRIFNFTLPYSYAVLYGILFSLISIYFLITHYEKEDKHLLLLASLFGGLAISSKYDFLPYILILLFFIFKNKSYKSLFALVFGIFSPFLILFIQGASIKDFINAFGAIKSFTSTKALETFYLTQGVYYTKRVWAEWFMEIFNLSIALFFIYTGLYNIQKNKVVRKIIGSIVLLFGMVSSFNLAGADSYLFLTFFTTVFFIFSFKKNKSIENLFILSSILISLKSFWGLSHANYGLYFIPLIFISFFIMSKNIFTKNCTKCFILLVLGMSISYFCQNVIDIIHTDFKIETKKGTIAATEDMGKSSKEIINYINNIKEENPKVMIYPEGLMFNFLADKKTETENFYNSLIPLYTEGFGEDEIIENLKNKNLDYIILSNQKTESYGQKEICKTYAYKICSYIFENYREIYQTTSSSEEFYTVYKRK